MRRHQTGTVITIAALVASLSGCGPGGDCDEGFSVDGSVDTSSWASDAVSDSSGWVADATSDAAGVPPDEFVPAPGREVVESDLYKLDGDWLYVHNEFTGLNVVDVSRPGELQLTASLEELSGPAGELYVLDDRAFVLIESTPALCPLSPDAPGLGSPEGVTEIAAVVGLPHDPKVAGRHCMPGELVSSRIVGDVLYAVTTGVRSWEGYVLGDTTWVLSIDLADPRSMILVDYRVMAGESHEIHVTPWAMFVAQSIGSRTEIDYIDILDPGGIMYERGSITVPGEPQGRWHMDAWGSTFRIVTYSGLAGGTNLHVIDTSDPDHLQQLGTVSGLAEGEELWATRFVGEKVYIVTYLRFEEPDPWEPPDGWWEGTGTGSDPLWVISLEDPRSPEIQGELIIPGWSNFIFPRGDRLLTAGRGTDGELVAMSLFDVSDPYDPLELRRLEIGRTASTSEVNEDHRGVTILEDEESGDPPLVVIPYTNDVWSGGRCTPVHHLQLIDLLEDDLVMRGDLEDGSLGRVVRTTPLGGRILSISDRSVGVVHYFDRDRPGVTDALVVGDPGAPDPCTTDDPDSDPWGDDPWDDDPWDDRGGWDDGGWEPSPGAGLDSPCSAGCAMVGPGSGSPRMAIALAAILLLVVGARARKRAGRG